MAQKNFFGLVTLIACLLAYLPAEILLVSCLSDGNMKLTLSANLFGILAGAGLIYGLFNRFNRTIVSTTASWAVLSCVVAGLLGWKLLAALVGGATITIIVFLVFVLAIIHYEDLGAPRKL